MIAFGEPQGARASGVQRKRIKVCLVCSHGGHLTEMLQLGEAFEGHDAFYFCYDADTTRALPNAYRVRNMARNPLELVKNCFRVLRIFLEEKPDLVVSTGAEIALAVLPAAKIFRVPIVYIECGAQVVHPSFTGRIMYWLADAFYVQWKELVSVYGPRARFRGSLIDEDDFVAADEKRATVTLVRPALPGPCSIAQPPIGLASLASALERHGCGVRVIDAQAEKLSDETAVRIVAQQTPDIVGVSVSTPALSAALRIAQQIRTRCPDVLLVAGGPHASVCPDDLLAEGAFDYVVRGEGERTLTELMDAIAKRGDVAHVAGVSFRKEGSVVHNPDRMIDADIDALPLPDWALFPLKRYAHPLDRNDYCLPILTRRGGPRTPECVAAEWQALIERYSAREVAVLDDLFAGGAARALGLCDLLIARGLNRVPWSLANGIRADCVTTELCAAIRRAGCYRVYIDAAPGLRDAVARAKRAGLETGGCFTLGKPGETAVEMDATIEAALDLRLDYARFSVAPGAQPLAQQKLREAVRRFYIRPRFILRQARQLCRYAGWRHTIIGAAAAVKRILFGGH